MLRLQTWRILFDLMDEGVTSALLSERRKLRLFGVILQSLFHLLPSRKKRIVMRSIKATDGINTL